MPIRHLYPSQPGLLNRVSMIAGVLWTPLVGWLIWKLPGGGESRVSESTLQLAFVSLLYPLYYLARLVGDQRDPLAEAMANRRQRA